MEPCLGCLYASGGETPPGGVLLRTDNWMINHCVGPLGVGTLVIAPTRHVTRVSELTDEEVVELGRLIRRSSQVVEVVVAPEQIYVCLWSHGPDGPTHLHWVIQPVTSELVDRHGGKRSEELQLAMFEEGNLPPTGAVEAFCTDARHLMSRS